MTTPTKTLLLIDANSLIHRAFHALPPLTTPDNKPAQALYGISSILLKLWREERPDYAAALFDRPEPTFREERYAAYKATRPQAPDDLIFQIISAHELFPAFGIPVYEQPGFEADDLIATLALRFGGKGGVRATILTGDLDTLQLVRDGKIAVKALKTGVSQTTVYDEAAVRERYGLEPKQLADYKALVGDQSDNVKGVPGIGPKTAVEILKKFGTLERALAGAKDDPKLAVRLLPHQKEAELAKFLVVLGSGAELPVRAIDDLRVDTDDARLAAYFTELGFASLTKRLAGAANAARSSGAPPRPAKKLPPPPQGTIF